MGLFSIDYKQILAGLERPEVKKYFNDFWLKIREDVKSFLREEIKKAIAEYFEEK